jgi:hypothetical protein
MSAISIVWASYQWVMFENNEQKSAISIVWASYQWVMFENKDYIQACCSAHHFTLNYRTKYIHFFVWDIAFLGVLASILIGNFTSNLATGGCYIIAACS